MSPLLLDAFLKLSLSIVESPDFDKRFVGIWDDFFAAPAEGADLRVEGVVIAAHGNSLRSLVMVLDKMDTVSITQLNLGTGIPMIYKLNADSTVASKEVLGDMSQAH